MAYLVKYLAVLSFLATLHAVLTFPAELEKTPYEFAFSLGTQHREEKKDENGIVTGEYGFETADGYYNSVQYATDEEGRFRIIGRKRVRIGPPKELPKPAGAADGSDGLTSEGRSEESLPTTTTTTTTTTTERVKIYQFNYTAPEHAHQEMGFSDTSKMGEYSWDSPDGYRWFVTYNADDAEGYKPIIRQVKINP